MFGEMMAPWLLQRSRKHASHVFRSRSSSGNVLSASTLDYMRSLAAACPREQTLSLCMSSRSIEKEVRSMEPFRKLCETAEPRLGREEIRGIRGRPCFASFLLSLGLLEAL